MAAAQNLRLAALPDFVTPEWLREHHHLMKADLRKLAAEIAEDYSDWPAAADGSDEAAFWRAVHELSQVFALAVPHEEAIRIRDDLAFFQAVRSVLAKRAPASQTSGSDERSMRSMLDRRSAKPSRRPWSMKW